MPANKPCNKIGDRYKCFKEISWYDLTKSLYMMDIVLFYYLKLTTPHYAHVQSLKHQIKHQ